MIALQLDQIILPAVGGHVESVKVMADLPKDEVTGAARKPGWLRAMSVAARLATVRAWRTSAINSIIEFEFTTHHHLPCWDTSITSLRSMPCTSAALGFSLPEMADLERQLEKSRRS
jgi:hypothetical protein